LFVAFRVTPELEGAVARTAVRVRAVDPVAADPGSRSGSCVHAYIRRTVFKFRTMARRLVVKPGIAGLWQVSGRSDLAWADTVRLDLRYVENWSLALDLQILWKTGSAVFHGHGAY
jgi:hypothetical protein